MTECMISGFRFTLNEAIDWTKLEQSAQCDPCKYKLHLRPCTSFGTTWNNAMLLSTVDMLCLYSYWNIPICDNWLRHCWKIQHRQVLFLSQINYFLSNAFVSLYFPLFAIIISAVVQHGHNECQKWIAESWHEISRKDYFRNLRMCLLDFKLLTTRSKID